MTDKELRDAAIAELKLTTVGWNKVANYSPEKLATTYWGKGLNLLAQISAANAIPRNAAVVYLKKTTKGYSPTATNWKAAFAELAKITDVVSGWTKVADEWGTFTLAASADVRYGKNTTWVTKTLAAGSHECATATFGSDPLVGTPKECQVSGAAPPPPPPPPPPPTGGTRIPSDGVIRSGGVWYGDPFVGTVTIATTEPVILTGDIRKLDAGYMIDAYHSIPGAGIDVTCSHLKVLGATTYQASTRWFVARDWKRIVIVNCSIENTRGIELWPNAVASSTVLISKCRHKNILGGASQGGLAYVGNFVQFRTVLNTAIEVSWNEIVNEPGKSEPEDIISIYHTNNVHMFDNMLWHQSEPSNTQGSQGGITIDGSDAGAVGCNNNLIERNQVVDGMGIITYCDHAGDNNMIQNNRVVADQFLPDGRKKGAGWGAAIWIKPGPGDNNHAHGNYVNYVDRDGWRGDPVEALKGAPEGGAAEAAKNTIVMTGVPSKADEDAEWQSWLTKVAAAGITIGA